MITTTLLRMEIIFWNIKFFVVPQSQQIRLYYSPSRLSKAENNTKNYVFKGE